MLVHDSIPTLINGVSQQPDSLRLPTQAEEQINFHSSVVEGLSDRPPTEHIAKIHPVELPDIYPHFINRSSDEQYVVLFQNGNLSVCDLSGNNKTVLFPHGTSYLSANTPSTDMRAITVADHTFVLNTTKTTSLKANTTPSRAPEAMVFVRAGHYGSNYRVYLNGTLVATKTTSTSVVTDLATEGIAETLRAAIAAAGWNTNRFGSVIHIAHPSSANFTIKVEDSQGGTSMYAFKDTVQSLNELPTIAPTNFQIKVVPEAESEAGAYYVKFVPSTVGESFGEGTWEETIGFGVQYQINPSNMPHLLIRNTNGTFTFQQAVWDDQTVGDVSSVPPPSFIGKKISDVFFFKNRLGILADDNQIYSEIGGYFNFYPSTVTTDIDSDPIDYRVSHTKVPILKHALPFSEKLLLFSDQTQFIAQGNPTFTKKTLTTDPATEFENRATCRPIGLGKNAYFVFNRGQFDGVREYFIDQNTQVKDAIEVTAQIPKYIPAGVFRFISSTTEDILIALTSGDYPSMYVYKFFYANNEKLQSSWSKMVMGGSGTKVFGGEFIGSILYIVVQRTGGIYLEKMNYAPGVTDPSVNFVTHYDRRVTNEQCVTTYNAGFDTTTWTLPYPIDGTIKVVTRETNPGQIINTVLTGGTSVEVAGNRSNTKVYIGQTYQRSFTFSKFYLRKQEGNSTTIVTAGRLQLRTGTIIYAKSGTFKVTVIQDHRDPNNYVQFRDPHDAVFTGRVLGAGSNLLGVAALADGEFKFPILAENLKVTITVSTDSFLPCHLLGAEWEGMYHSRSAGR